MSDKSNDNAKVITQAVQDFFADVGQTFVPQDNNLPSPTVISTPHVEVERVKTDVRTPCKVQSEDKQVKDDFDYARENLYDSLEKGRAALEELVDIANQNQQSRAYEVVATLMKQITETSEKLLGLHQQKKDLKSDENPEDEKPQHANTINNNTIVFNGSTTDLQELLAARRKKQREEDSD